MQKTIQISTSSQNGLYDITRQVEAIVTESGVQTGMVNVYAQGASTAIMMLFILIYPIFVVQWVIYWDIVKRSLFNEKLYLWKHEKSTRDKN